MRSTQSEHTCSIAGLKSKAEIVSRLRAVFESDPQIVGDIFAKLARVHVDGTARGREMKRPRRNLQRYQGKQ